MDYSNIIAEIDAEISKLRQAKALLSETTGTVTAKRGPGRPKGSIAEVAAKMPKLKKRTMSAEGKAKIAAAQKKRWAAQKAVATKAPTKKASAKNATK